MKVISGHELKTFLKGAKLILDPNFKYLEDERYLHQNGELMMLITLANNTFWVLEDEVRRVEPSSRNALKDLIKKKLRIRRMKPLKYYFKLASLNESNNGEQILILSKDFISFFNLLDSADNNLSINNLSNTVGLADNDEIKASYYLSKNKNRSQKIRRTIQTKEEIHDFIRKHAYHWALIFNMNDGEIKVGEVKGTNTGMMDGNISFTAKTYQDLDWDSNLFDQNEFGEIWHGEEIELSEILSVKLFKEFKDMYWR